MKFVETALPGAYLIEMEPIRDERGFFARSFCRDEFLRQGLNPNIDQCNVSFNAKRGTLRGMHYQARPHAEAKLVRCTQGAIYDVILDLRAESSTCGRWFAVEISAENRHMLYVPEGVAHGFQTLADSTEVFYQMSSPYCPGFACGVRWDDPAFGIEWPPIAPIISDRDLGYPSWEGAICC